MPAPNLLSGDVLVRRSGCHRPAGEARLCSHLPHQFPPGPGVSHILLLRGTPAFLSQTQISPSPLSSWALSRRAQDWQGSVPPTSGAQRCKFTQAPSFCRLLMTNLPLQYRPLTAHASRAPVLKPCLGAQHRSGTVLAPTAAVWGRRCSL